MKKTFLLFTLIVLNAISSPSFADVATTDVASGDTTAVVTPPQNNCKILRKKYVELLRAEEAICSVKGDWSRECIAAGDAGEVAWKEVELAKCVRRRN